MNPHAYLLIEVLLVSAIAGYSAWVLLGAWAPALRARLLGRATEPDTCTSGCSSGACSGCAQVAQPGPRADAREQRIHFHR